MKNFISLVAALLLASITTLLVRETGARVAGEVSEAEEHPGYFEQFMAMKANSNGIIPGGLRTKWHQQNMLMKSSNGLLDSVQEAGPNIVGGRTRAILIDKRDPNLIWAAAVSGGLWRSRDGGVNWEPIDDFAPSLAVTCLAQNPFNPLEIIYGTGEGRGNSAGVPGEGLFISRDGGESFEQLESSADDDFNYVWDVEYSKTDSNTFYVATDASGLFRSTDGGETLEKVFNASNRIFRIQTLPDSTIFFARESSGAWRGHESDMNAFRRLTNGLPTGSIGRANVAYCEGSDSTVYLSIYHSNNEEVLGIYRSDDRGDSWSTLANPDVTLSSIGFKFGWYAHMLDVSPVDPDIVLVGYQNAAYSTNGGSSWQRLSNSHADYHIAVFYPNSSNALVGNDGGIYRYGYNPSSKSYSFTDLNRGYNVTQFYAGTYFPEANDMMGGTQDNGTWNGENNNRTFDKVYGGDGAYCEIDALGERLYYSTQNGNLRRYNYVTKTDGSRYSALTAALGTRDFWFINPYTINRVDGTQLYFPSKNYVARSTNAAFSFDLVTDRIVGNIYAIAVSEDDDPLMYFGGQSAILYYQENAKTAMAGDEVKIGDLSPQEAKGGFIANIEIDPQEDSTIYIGMSNTSENSRIWKVRNANSMFPTWEDISGNLPSQLPVNWIEVDPLNSDHIIAATDFGLYTTVNGGGWWEKVEEIPNVSIHMIKLRTSDRKLFIYTHGRGVWTANLSNNPVSAEPRESSAKLRVFPNPVEDFAHIAYNGDAPFSVFDLSGRKVLQGQLEKGKMDLRALTAGSYILNVTLEGDRRYSEKILVK